MRFGLRVRVRVRVRNRVDELEVTSAVEQQILRLEIAVDNLV